MNARIAIGTLAAVVLLGSIAAGPMAWAAMTPAQQCSEWANQFDKEIKTHATHAKAAEAQALATAGSGDCKQNKDAEGAAKLEKALKTIDVKPKE
jgi:hypothetical protein